MTDTQRLDAYVQVAMARMMGAVSQYNASSIEFGCEQIYKFAKGMMDYVDAQEVDSLPEADAEIFGKNRLLCVKVNDTYY